MAYLDLVADILQRVREHFTALPGDELVQIEQDVRADWGGERHYVAKGGESGRAAMYARDAAIRQEAARGVPEDYLSLRYNLSVKRIRQIVRIGT